jgi:hypothetical protein
MARYILPQSTFDYTFDNTFAKIITLPGWQGGQFSPIFDDSFSIRQFFSGSLGGSTFQVSGRTFTIRHHAVPTLKKREGQLLSQSVFRGNVSRYQQTNNTERDTWQNARFRYPRTKGDGNTYFSNRYHLFISSNQNWSYSSGNNKNTIGGQPPNIFVAPSDGFINYGTSTFLLPFNLEFCPDGFNVQIFASRPVPPGDPNSARATLRLIHVFTSNDALNINLFSFYSAVWEIVNPVIGNQILCVTRLIPESDGQFQQPFTALAFLQ